MALPALAFDIQGHRGSRGLLPENTLPAFARALELGVTTLELDVGLTRDGVVVIYHDRTLNSDITRDASGQWVGGAGTPLWQLTYAELTRYDVGRIQPGTAYAKRFARQQPLDGTRIPRLSDLFALVQSRGTTSVRFNIETKISPDAPSETAPAQVFVDALLATINAARMDARVAVQSFDWRTLQAVQKQAPTIPTVYLTAERSAPNNVSLDSDSAWTAGFQPRTYGGVPQAVKAAGGSVWSPSYADLTAERVREAQALGLKVIPWTVNAEADMRRLIRWGVDGIISDYPDVLVRIVNEPR